MENKQPNFEITRIYTKDISFESPKSPEIFKGNAQFQIDVAVDSQARPLEEEGYFEVVLKVTVTAKIKESDDVAYLAETKQAGIFNASGFDDEQQGQVLNSACPNILFPYVREVISDIVTRGGFPPLYLAPINFDMVYAQQLEQAKKEAEAANKDETKH